MSKQPDNERMLTNDEVESMLVDEIMNILMNSDGSQHRPIGGDNKPLKGLTKNERRRVNARKISTLKKQIK